VNKYRVPALKRLIQAFPSVLPEDVAEARLLLQQGKVHGAKNKLRMFGLDSISDGSWGTPGTRELAVFLNAGDTYAVTLGRFTGTSTWHLTTLGDMVESLEKRGKRVF